MLEHLKNWYVFHVKRAFHLENGWHGWHGWWENLTKRRDFKEKLQKDWSMLIFVASYHLFFLLLAAIILVIYYLTKVFL